MLRKIFILMWCVFTSLAHATRDAETEHAFLELATPFVNVMDLQNRPITYRLIISPEFNAMVMGGDNVFFYSGLILELDTAEQFMAVMAHELSHIKSDDLHKVSHAHGQSTKVGIIGLLAGVVGSLASNGGGDGAFASASLGVQIANRSFKRYVRVQEQGADATAFKAFKDLKMSLRGHIEVQKKLLNKGGYISKQQSYEMTHPTSLQRLRNAQWMNERSAYKDVEPDSKTEALYQRIRAKLFGYVSSSDAVQAKYPKSDMSDLARYARAMHGFAQKKPEKALIDMRVLVEKYPQDIYYLDSYATILSQNKQYKEAVSVYKKILKMNRKTALFYIEYARNLIHLGDKKSLTEAEGALYRARHLERLEPYVYKSMIDLYRAMKHMGKVSLAKAEYAYMLGQDNAMAYAQEAKKAFKEESAEYIRADDIVRALTQEKE